MTPQSKAFELIEKYQSGYVSDGFNYQFKNDDEDAKHCALIAVDEIISICPYQNYKKTLCPYDGAELSADYWQEVKLEIEKL